MQLGRRVQVSSVQLNRLLCLQVGTYDPFSDDPQLGVQKIALCCATEMLFVGGTAGQVVVLHFEQEEKEVDVKVRDIRCMYHSLSWFTSLLAFSFVWQSLS